jgi:hypothetical protein
MAALPAREITVLKPGGQFSLHHGVANVKIIFTLVGVGLEERADHHFDALALHIGET